MFEKKWVLLLALIVAVGMLAACSDDKEEADGDIPAEVEFYAAGDSIDLNAEDAGAEFQIIPFWAVEEESGTGYTLNAGTAADSPSGSNVRLKPATIFENSRPSWMTAERYEAKLARLAWDRRAREWEKDIISKGLVTAEMLERSNRLRGKLSADCGDLEVARGDECLSLLDLSFMDFDGVTTDITVEIKGKGEHVAVAVDSDDSVSQSDVDKIVEAFDTVIYPRDHFFLGDSTIGGTDYVDRDGDGLRLIVLSHLVNESGAVGLFNPNDFIAGGNVSDILWVVVPDSDNPLASVFGTVAHEYYHMIMFGVKRVKFGADETIWLNESLAHTIEDLSGYGIDNVETALAFLENVNEVSLAFSGDAIEARGMGFLLVHYMYEKMGGAEYGAESGSDLTDKGGAAFLTSLVQTNKIGFEALNAALGSDWTESFKNWTAAVALDGREIANDPLYSFVDLYEDPLTGQSIGICTNCTRKNLDGDNVTYSGFACPDWEDGHEGTLQATGVDCVSAAAGQTIDAAADDDTVAFTVVRVK